MERKWFLITAAALALSACSSNLGSTPTITTEVGKVDNNAPKQPSSGDVNFASLSFRVTSTSKAITPFDEANGLVDANPASVISDDSKMSYTFDKLGAVSLTRIDPYDSKGQFTSSAYIMDFAHDTFQVMDKSTNRMRNALAGSKMTLSQMVDTNSMKEGSNDLSALTLSAFEREAKVTGFSIKTRSKSQVVYSSRTKEKQGDVLTTLTFDPNSQLLNQADTTTENDKLITKGKYTFTYQTVNGKQFPKTVSGLTRTEMKDKANFGIMTMPNAKVMKPGEILQLKPGEYVASEFTSPLRPGANDTSVYTYQTTKTFSDINFEIQ
jgi:hypothetical protein